MTRKSPLLAASLAPRSWLVAIAEEMPDWAAPLATWLVKREISRLERVMEANHRRAERLRWLIDDACRSFNQGYPTGRECREAWHSQPVVE